MGSSARAEASSSRVIFSGTRSSSETEHVIWGGIITHKSPQQTIDLHEYLMNLAEGQSIRSMKFPLGANRTESNATMGASRVLQTNEEEQT